MRQFGLGAAIPKWIDEGIDVYLICATNGEVGHGRTDELQGKFPTVAELRLSELNCAREYLKFKEVFMLGYRDSGMPGSDSATHPDSLWQQWRNQPESVAGKVREILLRVRPQVVITFNKYGGYGHPDHIAIQRATVSAFECLRASTAAGAASNGYRPEKLYYAAFPKATLWMQILRARIRGQDPRRMGINGDVDVIKILEHMEPVHARIRIAPYLDVWERASRCHASQGGGRISRTSRLDAAAALFQTGLYARLSGARIQPR